jgi:2,3-diketo-5-methylthio-1-phosphopentane phosphatase
MSAAKLYLLDVEGTVAPLILTTEVLFPYARKHLEEFLKANCTQISVLQDLMLLKQENRAESEPDAPAISPIKGDDALWSNPIFTVPFALKYLLWLMDRDRKSTALKSLQGKIWKTGFESGELKGTVFDDVPPAFERWAAQGKVAIYSSGSVAAQELFFRHSSAGDLTPPISGYFDTRTGPKMESASYRAIASEMGVDPGDAIFFSDVVRELDAAREAGFETLLTVRPGNAPVDNTHGHAMITTFEELG